MGSDSSKTAHERAALDRLVIARRPEIDRASISKLVGESMPDFSCRTIDGSDIAFELTEICSEDIAHLTAKARTGCANAVYSSDPTEAIIRAKLRKRYATALPIELVCYWGARTVSTDDMIVPTIRDTLRLVSENRFNRVWYVGQDDITEFANAS